MDIMIAVSDLKAKVHLHRAKQVEDIFDLMLASAALLPGIYGREINGVMSVDGGYTLESTVIKWLKRIKEEQSHRVSSHQRPIDLLYIGNRPHPRLHFSKIEEHIFNKFIDWWIDDEYPELARGARSIDIKMRMAADLFEKKRPLFRTCALYPMPDENIYPNTWRKRIIRSRGELTRTRTQKLLCALAPKKEI